MADNYKNATNVVDEDAEKPQEKTTPLSPFDKKGTLGKNFQPDGLIGSIGEAVGGPLASDGMIGKHFTAEGGIGGTIQKNLGGHK